MNNLTPFMKDRLKQARVILCEIYDNPFERPIYGTEEYEQIEELIIKIEKMLGVI